MDSGLIETGLARYKETGLKQILLGIFAAYLVYGVVVGIYRVYFHPLSKIPGPKLAAFTFWYEFYYDVYPHKFQYVWKIKQLHEQYGPIIRINPLQVHIHDHDYLDKIYTSGSHHKRDRCRWTHHSGSKTFANSMLESMDHDTHKMRRDAVSSFFSKRSVQALDPLVQSTVEKFLARLKGEMEKKGSEKGLVNLSEAFAGMTLDVISEYCFGKPMGGLTSPFYGKVWLDALHEGIQLRPFGRQFPWIVNTMFDMPTWMVEKLNGGLAVFNQWNAQMLEQIESIMKHQDGSKKKEDGRRTVFHDVRDETSGKLPPSEKEPRRLMQEASIFLGAGTETTSRTLAITTFYLMKHPDIGDKLRAELMDKIPKDGGSIPHVQLEALPYLNAVILEGLRVAHGVSSRQPRIATKEDLVYGQYTIPRGTPVMESAYLLHSDSNIYPEPFKFHPERWIENPSLKRHAFFFGRGSRSCLGMNLAFSELNYAIAMLWRRFRMEIYDTEEERDVLTTHDCFIGMPSLQSKGIKARILGEVDE